MRTGQLNTLHLAAKLRCKTVFQGHGNYTAIMGNFVAIVTDNRGLLAYSYLERGTGALFMLDRS